jgi:tRNA(fMet)-specific endonuclease VapC
VTLLLDTSAVSALMRREDGALAKIRGLRPGDLVLSSPVAAEIRYGLRRLPAESRRRTLLEAEYERLRGVARWLDWTELAASEFGRVKALLEVAGTPVGDMDLIVASIAFAAGGAVATTNAGDFVRIPGLRVDDWRMA